MTANSMVASHLHLLHMVLIISTQRLKCLQLQRRIVSAMQCGQNHATSGTTLQMSIARVVLGPTPMQPMDVVLIIGKVIHQRHTA